MKRKFVLPIVVILLAVLAGCPTPFSFLAPPAKAMLPADSINDITRPMARVFTFETLFPVQVELQIALYDLDPDGGVLPDPLPAGSAPVRVALTDKRGISLYAGTASEAGAVSTTVYLPSASEPVTLTLRADGFEDRTVVIGNMVEFERISRSMAMKRLASGARPVARSILAFTAPVTGSVLKVPTVTVAFEDLFGEARAGDADYNDFIASYDISETMDDAGKVVRIDVEARAVRKWAGYNHAFGIRIDSFEGSATLSGEFVNRAGQSVSYSRTVMMPAEIPLFLWSPSAIGKSARFSLEFDAAQYVQTPAAVASAALSRPPYNPYLFVYNTLHDIHLIGREPLSLSINPRDDFVDSEGFPWALLVPTEWESPAEGQRIEEAYPRFDNWRLSGGLEHTDWYNYPGEPWEPPTADIYVAGSYYDGFRDLAAYWKDDGSSVTRVDLEPSAQSEALDIAIDGIGNLYFAGYAQEGGVDAAVYWKNGTRIDLQDGSRATGIAVSGSGTVYVSGYYNADGKNIGVYWKDDGISVSRVELNNAAFTRATDIDVSSTGIVYVSGYYNEGPHDIAVYWRDAGTGPERTPLYTSALSQANALWLDGGDVHVAGRYLAGTVWASAWKNDAAGLRSLDSRSGNAKDIAVMDGVAHAAGDYLDTGYVRRAALWRLAGTVEMTPLAAGDYPAYANGMAVLDGDVYVAGVQVEGLDRAVYWTNGAIKKLSPDTESRANALAVLPKP